MKSVARNTLFTATFLAANLLRAQLVDSNVDWSSASDEQVLLQAIELTPPTPSNEVHNVYEGLMRAPFSMPYDQIALTNIFQIQHSGDYKLVAKGRIMKINADSTLSVVIFPPVSLMIHVSDEDIGKKSN